MRISDWSSDVCSSDLAESEFFRAKAFKNGNLHIWFKRDDLVIEVNKLLAEYYGASLGDASPETKARGNSRPNTSLARNFGFFPTPDEVADGVISEAYIQNGCRVLEPSAGTGALARRAADEGGIVTCIEVQPHLALQLEQEQRYESVFAMDFLALTPDIGRAHV